MKNLTQILDITQQLNQSWNRLSLGYLVRDKNKRTQAPFSQIFHFLQLRALMINYNMFVNAVC